ncbi:NAD-dependent deacetylase [Acidimicrobiia bacterium EGI L10123]|uniref:SIR2 family NAD-dependent protein deacylase n=1 Tax=Salinilacustrithrix flava TaxID=2957203 RepID=UPI003D7C23D7|nr:NAD-dependent deacetylase [Acidimicrobiia bacterium EGI L10123]
MEEAIEAGRELLAGAGRVVVLTGAGISTDSGIPDFRGPNGVWTKDPEAEKLATLDHYVSDPAIRAKAWQRRLETLSTTYEPNPGHHALVRLEQRGALDTLITQNVDGLHRRAGTSPDRLVEIHGTTSDVMCLDCDDRAPIEKALDRVRAGEADPACRSCGGILKTATISFGQGLVVDDLARADAAARRADLLLAVGSTLGVYPIANVVPLAKVHGAPVLIVNGGPTEMDDLADVRIEGSISEVLPALVG